MEYTNPKIVQKLKFYLETANTKLGTFLSQFDSTFKEDKYQFETLYLTEINSILSLFAQSMTCLQIDRETLNFHSHVLALIKDHKHFQNSIIPMETSGTKVKKFVTDLDSCNKLIDKGFQITEGHTVVTQGQALMPHQVVQNQVTEIDRQDYNKHLTLNSLLKLVFESQNRNKLGSIQLKNNTEKYTFSTAMQRDLMFWVNREAVIAFTQAALTINKILMNIIDQYSKASLLTGINLLFALVVPLDFANHLICVGQNKFCSPFLHLSIKGSILSYFCIGTSFVKSL